MQDEQDDRIDRAIEAAQRTVPDFSDQAPIEVRKESAKRAAMRIEGAHRSLLVAAHNRGVARDIAEHYRDELVLLVRLWIWRRRSQIGLSVV